MRLGNIIQMPIISEKSVALTEFDRYTFRVNKQASKGAIATEIETMYDVDVKKVRTMVMPGKKRRIRKTSQFITTPSWKKAIVTVESGQKIDLFSSLIGSE